MPERFLAAGIGAQQHPPGETYAAAETRASPAENGQILAIQRGHLDDAHAVLHPGGALAGLHLVCYRREGETAKRQGLGSG